MVLIRPPALKLWIGSPPPVPKALGVCYKATAPRNWPPPWGVKNAFPLSAHAKGGGDVLCKEAHPIVFAPIPPTFGAGGGPVEQEEAEQRQQGDSDADEGHQQPIRWVEGLRAGAELDEEVVVREVQGLHSSDSPSKKKLTTHTHTHTNARFYSTTFADTLNFVGLAKKISLESAIPRITKRVFWVPHWKKNLIQNPKIKFIFEKMAKNFAQKKHNKTKIPKLQIKFLSSQKVFFWSNGTKWTQHPNCP